MLKTNQKSDKPAIYIIGCVYTEARTKVCTNIIQLMNKVLNSFYEVIPILVYNGKSFDSNKKMLIQTIKGSNANAEFSAWQEGLDFLKYKSLIKEDSKFIFFNDTLLHHYFLRQTDWASFMLSVLKKSNNKGVISGEVVKLKKQGRVCNLPVDQFGRTALFFLDYKAIFYLNFKILNFKVEQLGEDSKTSFELLSKYLDSDVLSYRVGDFIFGGGWYKSKPYDAFEPNEIRLKVAMIINELSLSATLQKNEVQFIQSICFKYSFCRSIRIWSKIIQTLPCSAYKPFLRLSKLKN